jgi:hypothetical protein
MIDQEVADGTERNLMDISGFASIHSNHSHEELAALISKKLAGGIEFSGQEERYESPSLHTERNFLGIQLILIKGLGDSFTLEIAQDETVDQIALSGCEKPDHYIDLSSYLVSLLNMIDGVTAFEC